VAIEASLPRPYRSHVTRAFVRQRKHPVDARSTGQGEEPAMPADNEIYNQPGDIWWDERQSLHVIRTALNPHHPG
jgi:hypothetical protein